MTKIKSKYKSYCADCHFTVWQGEYINYDGKAHHLDCKTAIKDPTPRVMDHRYEKILGKPNMKKLRDGIDPHRPTKGRARLISG